MQSAQQARETCTGSCSLLDPGGLNPLGQQILHAAILQDESWQRVQSRQLLQSHLICGKVSLG